MHDHKKIGQVNKHVQGFPDTWTKVMQPEVMTGNGHQEKYNEGKKAKCLEKVSTYDVKLVEQGVWLNPVPFPEGTERPGALIIKNDKIVPGKKSVVHE